MINNTRDDQCFKFGNRSDLLPRLKQELKGNRYLSREIMAKVARETGISLSDIYSVATFYSFLPFQKTGKHVIKVCRCVPCDIKNAQAIIHFIEKEIGISPGETTFDGLFSFQLVGCIGACDQAPAMLIDDELFGMLTKERISEILESYRDRARPLSKVASKKIS